jgi:hypothetical protein
VPHFALLNQTLAIVKLIDDYPEATAWFIGGLLTVLGSLLGIYHLMMTRKMDRFEAKLEQHMGDEAVSFYKGLEAINAKLTEIQVENAEAHAAIISAHGERITRVESGLDNIARRMPNGELKSILSKLDDITQSLLKP